MQPSLILTGGSSVIAQEICQYWQNHHTDWLIHSPSRLVLDVTKKDQINHFFTNQHCNLLICCAGISENILLQKTTHFSFEKSLQANLLGAMRCAEAAAKGMKSRKSGHIIFISSYSALHPPIGQVAYATAKAALLGLTKAYARQWGGSNIRVNTILPGWIDSPMTQSVLENRRADALKEHTLGKFNSAEMVASFISHLHHTMINTSGQIFNLDSRIP